MRQCAEKSIGTLTLALAGVTWTGKEAILVAIECLFDNAP